MDAPLCRQCGGLFTNPAANQCRFCGAVPGNPYRPASAGMLAYQHAVNAGGRTSFFALRIVVIAIAVCLSAVAACVTAFAGE